MFSGEVWCAVFWAVVCSCLQPEWKKKICIATDWQFS